MSIRPKILIGCFVLGLLTLGVGASGLLSQRAVGALATRIYDQAFMSMSYLRAAQNSLIAAELDLHRRGSSPGSDAVNAKLATILDDLAVARDQAMSPAGRAAVEALREQVSSLKTGPEPSGAVDLAAYDQVALEFEKAVDIFAGDGFRYRREVEQLVGASVDRTLLHIAGAAVIAMGMGLVFSSRIVNPLLRLTAAMTTLARGDLDVAVADARLKDEIGAMARALLVFKNNELAARRLAVERGLDQGAQLAQARHVAELCAAHETSVADLLEALDRAAAEMHATSEDLIATVARTAGLATGAAAAAYQASGSVRTVAASVVQVSRSAIDTHAKAVRSAEIAGRATEEAKRADQIVQDLSTNASHISDVVRIISAIANQTNLLALNATIEAARAGEAGRGFAVVASEVKALAAQTARATNDIAVQIEAMQAGTGDVVAAIATVGATVTELRGISQSVSLTMDQQSVATRVIAESTQQVSAGTSEIACNVDGVSSGVEVSRAAASRVLSASMDVSRQATVLREQVSGFLQSVRAA
jgi:methyl-accepting chemotaxis protein